MGFLVPDRDRKSILQFKFEEITRHVHEWASELHEILLPLYNEPTVPHAPRPDPIDVPVPEAVPVIPPAAIWRDQNGKTMRCILCNNYKTIDGRYCVMHYSK